MGTLADILSEKNRQELILSSVSEGDVFRMHLGENEAVKGKGKLDDGRNKYFVLLGQDSEGNALGFVLIDSEINPYLPPRRKELHYPLLASKYLFLNGKNRFVDCSDFKVVSHKRFVELFGADKSKGKIEPEDLSYIKQAVISYEDASPKLLKRFKLISE